jgi:hypothetical protein
MDGLVYDMIGKVAEMSVPDRVHEMLHVNSRQAFTETATDLIQRKVLKPTVTNVKFMVDNWENLLYTKYSRLN